MTIDLADMLARHQPGYSMDRAFYTDPAIYQQDLENIWYREWLFVMPACQLTKTGRVSPRPDRGL